MKRTLLILTLLFLLLAPTGSALAAGPDFDRIIGAGEEINEDLEVVGGSLVVEEGATVNGSVSVLGGSATLKGDITGDVSVFGGTVDLSGTVDGDLVVFGGNVDLDSTAVVNGDLVVFGGNLDVADAAQVNGDCAIIGGNLRGEGQSMTGCDTIGANTFGPFISPPRVPDVPEVPRVPNTIHISRGNDGFFSTVGEVAGRSLMLGLLALVIAALVPAQLTQVSETISKKPAASGTVGLLTAVAGPSLLALLLFLSLLLTLVCIGVLGYPVVFVLSAVLAAAVLFGWVAAGNLLGGRLARMMNLKNRSLPVRAALGTAVLTLAAGLLSPLHFLLGGWLWSLAAFVIGCIGLGAVALTKFGTKAYPVGATNGEKVAAVMDTLVVDEDDSPPAKGEA